MESKKLRIGDEKRAIQEISNLRRLRRTIEEFQAKQAAIDREREQEGQLRAQLNDPEAKAISERYEKLKMEFDNLKREGAEAFANRNKLFGERSALQGEISALWNLKKESQQRFKDANDRYWTKVNEDRASRAEENRAKAREDEMKVKEDQAKVKKEDRAKVKVKADQMKVKADQTKVKMDQAKVKVNQAKVKEDQTKRGERMGQQRAPQEQQKLVGWTLPIPEYQTKTRDRQTPIVVFSKGTKEKGDLQGKTNAPRNPKKPHQRSKGANEEYWARREDLTRQHKAAEEQQKLDLDEMIQEGLYQIEIQGR